MELIKETVRSEMYFRSDVRTSSVLCVASRYLGMAVACAGLDSIILAAGQNSLKLSLTRQLHINSRVYNGQGADKDSITFLQKGQYYNRADVVCHPFVSNGEAAPAESRFEISCVADVIGISSCFFMKQDSDVAVAVMRLKGGEPTEDNGSIYYRVKDTRIYVLPTHNSVIEVCGDELIVKQPIMNVAGEDGSSVGLRFCAVESLMFSSPPLAVYVEARREGKTLRAELDRIHGVYTVNDERGSGDIEFYLENPFDRPICMPVLFTRCRKDPMGAVLYQNQKQTGIPVQICCERIRRGAEYISYYDYTVAPVIPPGARVGFEMKFINEGCASHVWTHGKEAQLARVELASGECQCMLDLMRSLKGMSIPSLKYQNKTHRAEILKVIGNDTRLDANRVRLTDIFCGELESYALQQLCTSGRELKADIRTSLIASPDHPRLTVEVTLTANADMNEEKICLLSIEGKNFYIGNDTSVSYISPFEGEGVRYVQPIGESEFAGFDSIGVVVRACDRELEARLYACEDGESYSRLEICLKKDPIRGEQLHFEFVICLLPDLESQQRQKMGASTMTDGQIMRRETVANKVTTVAITGEGANEIKAQDNCAEAMQSGGLGSCGVRFCAIEDVSNIGVVMDSGYRLPVQIELDKKGGYKLLALLEHPEKTAERRYYLK